MANSNVVIKSGLWYTVANFLTKGILFLSTPIFTRLMTQQEFGAFSNFSSWLSILVIVVTLNVEASLISARYDYEQTLDKYIFSALTLSSVSTLLWAVVCNLFMGPIREFLGLEPLYINGMFAYLLVFPALQLFQTQERFFFRYKTSAALSLVTTFGSCALSVLLVMGMTTNRLGGRIIGHILPTVVIGLWLYLLLARRGRSIDFGAWKYTLRVCLPYVPHLLSMTVLSSTDRIMITKMCGEADNALYSVAYNVAMIVTLLLTALNGAFSPWLAQKLAREEYDDVRQVSKRYIGIFMLFGIGLMLLAPEVLLIMGGRDYLVAKPVMVPVAIGCMCQFLYTLFVNVEQFYKKTAGMALASVSAAVLNYLLNWWLIPRFGYVAAAYTTLVGYLWLLTVHMLLVRRMKKQQVYSYPFVLGMMALLGVVGVAMGLLYTHDMLRYVVIAVYAAGVAAVGWRYRGAILDVFKK